MEYVELSDRNRIKTDGRFSRCACKHTNAHAHTLFVCCVSDGVNIFNQFRVTWGFGGKISVDRELSKLSDGGRARGGGAGAGAG
jgi:hypothetical protein